jgi:hypothetical protein
MKKFFGKEYEIDCPTVPHIVYLDPFDVGFILLIPVSFNSAEECINEAFSILRLVLLSWPITVLCLGLQQKPNTVRVFLVSVTQHAAFSQDGHRSLFPMCRIEKFFVAKSAIA